MQMKFYEPCKVRTAVELSKMPLTQMQAALEEQEEHFSAERRLSVKATDVLFRMRAGERIEATPGKTGRRFTYSMGGKRVDPTTVYQLDKHGYVRRSDILDEATISGTGKPSG